MYLLLLVTILVLVNGSLQDGCLTPEQQDQLEKAVTVIDGVMKLTQISLKLAASQQSDPQTAANLQEAARIIGVIDEELVQNLEHIAQETCGTCAEVTAAVQDIVKILEEMLVQIEPDWEDDPIFKSIVEAIDTILDIVAVFCPEYTSQGMDCLTCMNGVTKIQKLFRGCSAAHDCENWDATCAPCQQVHEKMVKANTQCNKHCFGF